MIEQLAELGFTNATIMGEQRGKTIIRIRTTKGWRYEKFATAEDIAIWATKFEPEA